MKSKLAKFFYSHYFIYTVVILIKLSYVRLLVFDEVVIWKTIFVEMLPLLLLFGLIELIIKRGKGYYYVFLNIIFSTVFLAVILYHEYYGTLITYNDLFQANQVAALSDMIISLLQPEFLLVYADMVLFGLWFIFKRSSFFSDFQIRRTYLSAVLVIILIAVFFNVYIYSDKSIINEMKQAEKMGILSYEVYAVYEAANKQFEDVHSITVNNIKKIKNIQEPIKRKYGGVAKDKNVIIIQLEAFQNFVVGLSMGDQEITPNLNNLMKESFYFPNFNSQIGKGNTSDAEFMVNTSLYPVGSKVMSKEFGKKEIPSFPRILNSLGYETLTLHTNDVSFWNRVDLYPALGFEKYYDKKYFGEEDKIAFGSSDEVLYKKSMDVLMDLKNKNQKFYAQLIGMSSHGPFIIPPEKVKITVPVKYKGTIIGDYVEATNYVDFALGKFISELKKNGLWDTSVIIIYGDHFGIPMTINKDEKALLADLIGREYTRDEIFNIPLFVKIPGIKNGQVVKTLGGQVDIMPTLASLMNVSLDDHIHFGQDLFNHNHNLLGERFYLPTGSFINDKIMFIPGDGFKDGMAISLSDHTSSNDILKYEDDFNRIHQLLELSDSYMNSLPARPIPAKDK